VVIGAAILVALLVLGGTAMHAQAPAGKHRPASVPEDYVVTPFGYFHPSCFKRLSEGDHLLKDEGFIRHGNGSYESIPACGHPHFDAKGEKRESDSDANVPAAISPGTGSGSSWIVNASTTTNTSYGELDATWTVPVAPSSKDGQTIFFFPGMQDNSKNDLILQPVLGWNADFANAWGIASWNCCAQGTVVESSALPVSAGDTITGTMKSTCSAGVLSCGSWNVITTDVTTNKATTLPLTSSQGETFNWAFSGVLEVYNVNQCSDYPPDNLINFSNVLLYDNNFSYISSPSWTIGVPFKGTPQCGYGGQTNAKQTMLTYGPPPAQPPTWTILNPVQCNTGAGVAVGPGNQGPLNCTQSATSTAPAYWKSDGSPFSVTIVTTGATCNATMDGSYSGTIQCSVALVCNAGTGGGTLATYSGNSSPYLSQQLGYINPSYSTCAGVTNLNQVQLLYSVSNQPSMNSPTHVTSSLSVGSVIYTIN